MSSKVKGCLACVNAGTAKRKRRKARRIRRMEVLLGKRMSVAKTRDLTLSKFPEVQAWAAGTLVAPVQQNRCRGPVNFVGKVGTGTSLWSGIFENRLRRTTLKAQLPTATSYPSRHPSMRQNCSTLPSDLTERRGAGGRGRRGVCPFVQTGTRAFPRSPVIPRRAYTDPEFDTLNT
jgi:hypothetical protein